MAYLGLLEFYDSQFVGNASNLQLHNEILQSYSDELRHLHWATNPVKSLQSKICAENLVELNMPYCNAEEPWAAKQSLVNLKLINLKHSKFTRIPDLSDAKKLEKLNLGRCINLVEASSIQYLTKLLDLNMKGCKSFSSLPDIVDLISLETLNLSDCTNLKELPQLPRSIKYLYLSGTAIIELPPSIGRLSRLVTLDLKDCEGQKNLPSNTCELKSLETLNIAGCSNLLKLLTRTGAGKASSSIAYGSSPETTESQHKEQKKKTLNGDNEAKAFKMEGKRDPSGDFASSVKESSIEEMVFAEPEGSKDRNDSLRGESLVIQSPTNLEGPVKYGKKIHKAGTKPSQTDTSSLINQLGQDLSICCLLYCSRSDYGVVASLNKSFLSIVRSGLLYKRRREVGIVEHWIYFSCIPLEWEAFDPMHHRWMRLPRMPPNECFTFSDKESLAVGTELLVFGKDVRSFVIYRYSILTNKWTIGMEMNTPRCLFGSASLGEIAIVAGGRDAHGNTLSSAELYNSETGAWETIPSMNRPRRMCSAAFMDGKFYVIGGMASHVEMLTCGEVYDLKTRTWRVICDMFPVRYERAGLAMAPPLVAVVNNELYAANYAHKELRKYDKEQQVWITLGKLPEQAISIYGWGMEFKSCGDRLIVVGGSKALGQETIELYSWVPSEGTPKWDMFASKPSIGFIYNAAVMGC